MRDIWTDTDWVYSVYNYAYVSAISFKNGGKRTGELSTVEADEFFGDPECILGNFPYGRSYKHKTHSGAFCRTERSRNLADINDRYETFENVAKALLTDTLWDDKE